MPAQVRNQSRSGGETEGSTEAAKSPGTAAREMSQEQETAALPKISETDRLKLHNLILQRQLHQEKLNVLIVQFLRSGEARLLNDKIEQFSCEIENFAAQIYVDAGVDPAVCEINLESGIFEPKAHQ